MMISFSLRDLEVVYFGSGKQSKGKLLWIFFMKLTPCDYFDDLRGSINGL